MDFLFLVFLLLPYGFSEELNLWQKVERETKRIRDQIKNNPGKVIDDLNRFLTNPQATTLHVLKRVLKIKERDEPEQVVKDVIQASEMNKSPNSNLPSFVKIQEFQTQDNQNFFTNSQQNCPSETVIVYFLGGKDLVPFVLQSDFLEGLKPMIESMIRSNVAINQENNYIMRQPGVHLTMLQIPNQPEEKKIVILQTQQIFITNLSFPLFVKLNEWNSYKEYSQDFFHNAPKNCFLQLKKEIHIYQISMSQDHVMNVLQEKRLSDLMSKITCNTSHHSMIENQSTTGYVTHQPYIQWSQYSLEIGYAIINTVATDNGHLEMTFLLSEITSPITPNCQIDEDFHRKYLTPSTGLSGVQWWLGIQALGSQEVKDVMEHPQHLSRTQTKTGEPYWYSVRTIFL